MNDIVLTSRVGMDIEDVNKGKGSTNVTYDTDGDGPFDYKEHTNVVQLMEGIGK